MELVILGWVFTGLLLVLVVTCVLAGRGDIPRNRLVGVRSPNLMRSDVAWRAGHAAGVGPAGIAFAVGLLCSAIGLVTPVGYWGTIVAMVAGSAVVFVRASAAAGAADRNQRP